MKKETKERFIKGFFIFTLCILTAVSGFLIYLFLFEPIENKIVYYLIVFALIMIFWMIYTIIAGLIIYKKEFLLNDTKLEENWERISPAYKKFNRNMHIISTIFLLIIGSLGIVDILIFKNWGSFYLIITGFGFALLNYINMKRLKK